MRHIGLVILAALVITACAGPHSPSDPPGDAKNASPVARRPLDAVTAPRQPLARQQTPPVASSPAIDVPATALYVCVSDKAGERKQTAIEFAANVGALCKRHPEMGPCQYERDLCRRSGGRVYGANGVEITQQLEDEYDRKVMRVRFRAN